ncbi:MerR family DNA-binding transcriptional regulator [Rhodococcus ruber]|uniref:MerR family DNA-binding transcriptional regulator n=1 Tax=Rhodococcus ruber TaxID=1830 RepID=A0ABT4M836_9NOCA|nr:MerR family DNA-binding transcriptional regulator [Rhodococcus ruber]MCZ4517110.1 MerR family DNA-binding transcriptional regulator [Rhodococcus ruber]
MMKIGEFAAVTGLSVKALRHYDEKGVLVPSATDEQSGYRFYDERQVRAGIVVRALRNAEVPLPAVAAALATGSADHILAVHHERRVADGMREDRAVEEAGVQLRALAVPVTVVERHGAAQPFVGRIMTVDDDDQGRSDDDADSAFMELFAQLQAAGLGPIGPPWTSFSITDEGQSELILCWPTKELLADWRDTHTVVGELPARNELVASWIAADAEAIPSGTMNPAVVALYDQVGLGGVIPESTEIRQASIGSDGRGIEVAMTISTDVGH